MKERSTHSNVYNTKLYHGDLSIGKEIMVRTCRKLKVFYLYDRKKTAEETGVGI